MLELLDDMRFMKQNEFMRNLPEEDKLNIIKAFKIQKCKAGQRIWPDNSDKINEFYMIIRGKTAIFHSETKIIVKDSLVSQNVVLLSDK